MTPAYTIYSSPFDKVEKVGDLSVVIHTKTPYPAMPLVRAGITIGSGTWICADAFIGPDVRVGHNSIVAARAVVVKDVGDRVIVGGNPARVIGARETPAVTELSVNRR